MSKFLRAITLDTGIVTGVNFDELTADDLPRVAGVAGGYTNMNAVVDQWGRIISASNGSGGTPYTDEEAQDAVGSILTDSSSIDFTYNDAAPSITAVVKDTTVTPGTYTNATLTVGADGRLTAASTGSGGSGAAIEMNETQAAALVNGGSLFADHFPGSSLDAAWTVPIGTLSVSTVKYSVFASDIASGTAYVVRTVAPAGAFRVEGRFNFPIGASGHGLVAMTTGTTEGGISFMCVDNSGAGTGSLRMLQNVSGVYVPIGAAVIGTALYGRWVYLRLDRDGSNGWTGYYSWDRVVWVVIGTASLTFTVARIGIRLGQAGVSSVDFVDVVS